MNNDSTLSPLDLLDTKFSRDSGLTYDPVTGRYYYHGLLVWFSQINSDWVHVTLGTHPYKTTATAALTPKSILQTLKTLYDIYGKHKHIVYRNYNIDYDEPKGRFVTHIGGELVSDVRLANVKTLIDQYILTKTPYKPRKA